MARLRFAACPWIRRTREVTARAGVGIKTVSRVLNDEPNVRPQTREHILAAVDELGYRRIAIAISIRLPDHRGPGNRIPVHRTAGRPLPLLVPGDRTRPAVHPSRRRPPEPQSKPRPFPATTGLPVSSSSTARHSTPCDAAIGCSTLIRRFPGRSARSSAWATLPD
ncbi:helix-turn-helix domain-containing protein [Glycomyces salinus]|uniref:helix-turn-helix domain-containing protein n=1 Tax=Glycomyces salinus TaxID=980294 RepID=UPI0018EC6CB3|nr:LacI family DNA-binding transcriptional regulator [Glycomyces salinus]